MKKNKLLYSIVLLSIFLVPIPAMAHGEQVLPFYYSLGISFALSAVIATFKIEGKYQVLLVIIYFLVVFSFILLLSSEFSPNVISEMYYSWPKSVGFLFNLIAFVFCFSVYSVMKKEKLDIINFAALLYLFAGFVSAFLVGYQIIHYYLLSSNAWYLVDLSIAFLDTVGFCVILLALLKKKSDRTVISFCRYFIALGLMSALSLVILRLFFHMAIPRFPLTKLLLVILIIDGIIIKIIHDRKIKQLTAGNSSAVL